MQTVSQSVSQSDNQSISRSISQSVSLVDKTNKLGDFIVYVPSEEFLCFGETSCMSGKHKLNKYFIVRKCSVRENLSLTVWAGP